MKNVVSGIQSSGLNAQGVIVIRVKFVPQLHQIVDQVRVYLAIIRNREYDW